MPVRFWAAVGAALLWTLAAPPVRASATDDDRPSAPVRIDGNVLFAVRGTAEFPAAQRADAITARIETFATDPVLPAEAVHLDEVEDGTAIVAGKHRFMTVQDSDARLESEDRRALALQFAVSIRDAVADYRQARTRPVLIKSVLRAGAASLACLASLGLLVWLSRRLHQAGARRYWRHVRLWGAASLALSGARAVAILALGSVTLQYVLGLFPWTRGGTNRLSAFMLDPLRSMARGAADQVPDLLFLAILFLATHYLLRLTRLVFGAVERGEVALAGFDRDWAEPTFRLLRVAVVGFALVIAYPHIPGSGSEAFKGIAIFLALVLALGSSGAIANLIAGYTMLYRRAFRVGDRVQIGGTIGDVTARRIQTTHLRTLKNEEVVIPNATVLGNELVNFSALARSAGLILHTTVGIGYETPWRQVKALLLAAAERTQRLLKEPAPFVRQKALGDFAVTYELNGYCNDARAMDAIYAELHANILDVFNEYGVQIMTPAYDGDPELPKVVPRERWYAAPARPEPGNQNGGLDEDEQSKQ